MPSTQDTFYTQSLHYSLLPILHRHLQLILKKYLKTSGNKSIVIQTLKRVIKKTLKNSFEIQCTYYIKITLFKGTIQCLAYSQSCTTITIVLTSEYFYPSKKNIHVHYQSLPMASSLQSQETTNLLSTDLPVLCIHMQPILISYMRIHLLTKIYL